MDKKYEVTKVDGVYNGAAVLSFKDANSVEPVARRLHDYVVDGRNIVARRGSTNIHNKKCIIILLKFIVQFYYIA